MEDGQEFVDYYRLLQVNPDCNPRILEIAYHHFAKLYHPDNADTADVAKFGEVVEAYKVLKDPETRAEYDQTYLNKITEPSPQFTTDVDSEIDEKTAARDAEMHRKILLHLYKRRREHASDAGVTGWFLQEILGCSYDHFEFHIWYLKSKGFIEITEQGTWAATIQGVDHVISTCRTNASEKLMIAQSDARED